MAFCGMVHIWWRCLLLVNIYMCLLCHLRIYEWGGDDDHTMLILCLVSILVNDLGCVATVVSIWASMLGVLNMLTMMKYKL